jgi:F-type H+-transporting ATPase subunit b
MRSNTALVLVVAMLMLTTSAGVIAEAADLPAEVSFRRPASLSAEASALGSPSVATGAPEAVTVPTATPRHAQPDPEHPRGEAPATHDPTEAAHSGGKHEEPGLFSFDPVVLVSQFINFFVLLFLLRRFFFGPIGEIIEARRCKVAGELEQAARRRAEAEALAQEYQAKLASFEQTCYQLRQAAIIEGQKARDAIIAEAQARAAALEEQARREIALERERTWAGIKEKMVDLTMRAAEKVIEASLDDKLHHDLIRRTIDQLDAPGQHRQAS